MLELILLGIEGSMENILSGIWATGEGIQEYGFRQKWGREIKVSWSKFTSVNPLPKQAQFWEKGG